jgi:glutamate-1-semialdehyde 2,1-aminomutase
VSSPSFFDALDAKAARLAEGPERVALQAEVPLRVNRAGSLLTPFFTDAPVANYEDARLCDTARFGRFFHALLDAGVYFPPSQFEAVFVSAAHTDADLDATIEAAAGAFGASR